MAKHTALPWEAWGNGEFITHIREKRANGVTLLTMQLPHTIDDVAEQNANAEFIVRACNSHDALVTACGNMRNYIKHRELLEQIVETGRKQSGNKTITLDEVLLHGINAALALAEVKE